MCHIKLVSHKGNLKGLLNAYSKTHISKTVVCLHSCIILTPAPHTHTPQCLVHPQITYLYRPYVVLRRKLKILFEEVGFKANFEGKERRATRDSERKRIPGVCSRDNITFWPVVPVPLTTWPEHSLRPFKF